MDIVWNSNPFADMLPIDDPSWDLQAQREAPNVHNMNLG